MNCIRSRSNKCPYHTIHRRVRNWEMLQGAIAKLEREREREGIVTVVVPDARIWFEPWVSGFTLSESGQLLLTASLLHANSDWWTTTRGDRHLARCNCSLVAFNAEIGGREEKKELRAEWTSLSTGYDERIVERIDRSNLIFLCPPDTSKIRVFHPSLLHFTISISVENFSFRDIVV